MGMSSVSGKVAALVVAALVASSPASAQDTRTSATLSGIVLDALTRAPVAGVSVDVIRDDVVVRRTYTDSAGNFSVASLQAGSYMVRAERMGYEHPPLHVITLTHGETVRLDVVLNPGPFVLDSILVAARTRVQPLRRVEQLIHGRLVDAETGAPISGGTITLVHPGEPALFGGGPKAVVTTISNKDGLFRIVSPAPGRYTLRGEYIGYQTAEGTIIMMLGDTVRIDFDLSTRAIPLAPIVVLGSARPWNDRYDTSDMGDFYRRMARWEGAGHGEFVTREELDGYAARGMTLTQVVGRVVLRNPRGCGGGTISYLNGGLYFGGAFPIESLEAVEVYTAPFLPGELLSTFNPGGGPGRWPCQIISLWTRRQPKGR